MEPSNRAIFVCLIGTVIFTALVSYLLTGASIWIARRFRLVAHPEARSSHETPTPQLGGTGVCLTLLIPLTLLLIGLGDSFLPFLAVWIIVAGGCILGLWDDLRSISAGLKLAGVAMLSLVPFLLGIISAGAEGAATFPVGIAWTVFGIAWMIFFINAFNFMDGVNGQSGIFACIALLWLSLIMSDHLTQAILFFGGSALLGFLPWNFPRARTFLGDCGSLPIGGLIAFIVLWIASTDFALLPGLMLVLGFYVYDVIYTLIRRISRGENVFRAHRSHLYQRLLIASKWSHARLLFFHLPWYMLTGWAGWAYCNWSITQVRFLLVVAVAALLFLYTLYVKSFERLAEEETTSNV